MQVLKKSWANPILIRKQREEMCAVTDTDNLHVAMKVLSCKAARNRTSQVSVSLQTQKQKTKFGKPVNRWSSQPLVPEEVQVALIS